MDFLLVNFDVRKDLVLVVTYNDKTESVTREQFIKMLDRQDSTGPRLTMKTGRSLASLGKSIGIIKRDRPDSLTSDDCRRIMSALESFNDDTSGKRSSQLGRWLREMLTWESPTEELRVSIASFLKRNPGLEAIPVRKKAGGG